MKIVVSDRQCIADIALQACGSLEAALVLAERNGLSLTDDVPVGRVLDYELADMLNKHVVKRYAADHVVPAVAVPGALAASLLIIPTETSGIEELEKAADASAPLSFAKIFTNQFDIQMA